MIFGWDSDIWTLLQTESTLWFRRVLDGGWRRVLAVRRTIAARGGSALVFCGWTGSGMPETGVKLGARRSGQMRSPVRRQATAALKERGSGVRGFDLVHDLMGGAASTSSRGWFVGSNAQCEAGHACVGRRASLGAAASVVQAWNSRRVTSAADRGWPRRWPHVRLGRLITPEVRWPVVQLRPRTALDIR